MALAPRSLFESATRRGRVLRQGEIVGIVMDGAGAVMVFTQEFVGAQKWAQSRPPTANLLSDRARFLDQFAVLISRPGSVQGTRGNDRQLEKLARAMLAAGYDLSEFTLPAELRTLGQGRPPPAANVAKPRPQDDPEPPAEPDTPSSSSSSSS